MKHALVQLVVIYFYTFHNLSAVWNNYPI